MTCLQPRRAAFLKWHWGQCSCSIYFLAIETYKIFQIAGPIPYIQAALHVATEMDSMPQTRLPPCPVVSAQLQVPDSACMPWRLKRGKESHTFPEPPPRQAEAAKLPRRSVGPHNNTRSPTAQEAGTNNEFEIRNLDLG